MKCTLLFLVVLALLALLGCSQGPTDEEIQTIVRAEVKATIAEAVVTPISQKDIFDLTQGSAINRASTASLLVGDRVEVIVEVHQKYSPSAGVPCASPTLMDSFGNSTELAFREKEGSRQGDENQGFHIVVLYGTAFFPAADGEYSVSLIAQSCDIRIEGLDATVNWTIHRQ